MRAGAAYLAGRAVGLWDVAPASAVTYDEFAPGARRSTDDWRTAVARATPS